MVYRIKLLQWERHLTDSEFKLTNLEFMKTIFYLKNIQLGPVGEAFLSIISGGAISASGISALTNKLDKRTGEMPYGNVHTRVKRLHKLGLIEVEGKYARGEIKYKITSSGLFKLALDYGISPYALLENKDDIILQTLLYQFFEVETIKKFITVPRVYAIRDYLRNISNAIVKKLEELRQLGEFHGPQVVSEIEDVILREIEQFVFLIIIPWKASPTNYWIKKSMDPYKNEKLWFRRSGSDSEENENGPNYKDLFPKPALMNDKKFLVILKEIRDNFDKGCKDYLLSLRMLHKP